MIWDELWQSDPDLANLGEERFNRTGLVLIATLRKDGWPRISPVEPLITGGRLYLGMMWQSRKALDLLRDPRCTVHNTISNKDGTEGEFKVYGRAVDIQDPDLRQRYAKAFFEKLGLDPTADGSPFHLFSIDIESVAFAILENNETWTRKLWKAG
ncbi:MAG: hypothetical protein BZY79_06485 [SAR202 cluster bacterium Casp-Chloro-G4]|nr:pyridoxamine 5'-phosphate oxidase family protein [Chloroflexota bacterium]MDA1227688.1 pyridoxamine 5'-phosphate oxidase family protein [Chloroflexota bacterium]PKB60914.1 MAG: hypothetical protein BZY79_06485 [SAR202 cluster bacterium Casp-Chloro-G4]